MCGRFVMLTREEVLEVVAAVEKGLRPTPLGNRADRAQAFPGSIIDALGKPDGACALGRFTWGFPVTWDKKPVFNTRMESLLAGKGMWSALADGGRCIIPAVSFFEPHATETVRSARTGRALKRAYEFSEPAEAPLLLAGLCDDAHCSIVTTEPNRWVAPIHRRMPLVLRFEEVPLWLEGSTSDVASLADRTSLQLIVSPDPRQNAQGHDDTSEPAQLSLF